MSRVFLVLLLTLSLEAKELKDMISNMFIIGFEGQTLPNDLKEYISKNDLGGVILFSKNIKDKKQLIKLTKDLNTNSKSKLLISVDQEGGLVERLKAKDGFIHTKKPFLMSKMGEEFAKKSYSNMANMLKEVGINTNFAPVVDLAINPKNQVIVKYGRSFSSNPDIVIKYASIFIKEMQKERILSVIKHFPGHGSSLGDSHKGFVDVSETWNKNELLPFLKLHPKAIMSAHIYNKNLDQNYPATLSKKTLSLLRDAGVKALIISDDLQMGAISKNYDLNTTLKLAINSGVDMLLFGNQLSKPVKIEFLVARVLELVRKKEIDLEKIIEADSKIDHIKRWLDGRE